MRQVVVAFILFFANVSFASGNRVGNGGDVLKCSQDVKLLDFYESSNSLRDFKTNSDYKDIAGAVLGNLEKLNPAQAKQYRNRLDQISSEIEFRPDVELSDVKDSKHAFSAKNKDCKLLQIAIRRNQVSTETKRFVIDEDLWKELNNTNKAGLILHEIIYEHFYKLGEEDSQKARTLNAYLFSAKAFEASQNDYWNLIKSLRVPIYK